MHDRIAVSRVHNQVSKRRAKDHTKCGFHYRMYINANGKFQTKVISRMEYIRLKAKFAIIGKKHKEKRKIMCDLCGFTQEDNKQNRCISCGK